uniref:ATP-dependent DNA helicase PIF1-like n=1 Tax=Tanacetum cinerariifolium TaxID=118510 RepID=A0A6L2L261_TANCI|nr:ATP-dependent DNA helicase PIF1-like [Tanacetum cinerariifolium]
MRLTVGARPEDVTELREFAKWILKVKDRDIEEHYDGEVCIDLPEQTLLDAADDLTIRHSSWLYHLDTDHRCIVSSMVTCPYLNPIDFKHGIDLQTLEFKSISSDRN